MTKATTIKNSPHSLVAFSVAGFLLEEKEIEEC
jgi:hypothetical protein